MLVLLWLVVVVVACDDGGCSYVVCILQLAVYLFRLVVYIIHLAKCSEFYDFLPPFSLQLVLFVHATDDQI